jgi:Sulfatase-modifying factor enzyme 1/Immunoglobulin I-set domain
MRRLISLSLICAMMTMVTISHAASPEVDISLTHPDTFQFDWQAIPGQTYHVMTTTDMINGPWTDLTPGGLVMPNVLGSYSYTTSDTFGLFRIMKKDTNPPAISSLLPSADAIAVDSGTSVTIVLTDETGIDTNSIILSVAGWTDLTLPSPYLSYNANTLIFTPPSSLGGPGEVISDTLTVADVLGNTLTNYTWTFQLGRPVVATSDFLSLSAPPSAPLSGPSKMSALAGDEYYITDVTDTEVIISYTGTPPVITVGDTLVSFDPAHPFYRKSVSSQTDTGQQLITVLTTDLQLTDLVSTGSLSTTDFTTVDPIQTMGVMAAGTTNMHVAFGDDLSGTVLWEDAGLKLHLPSASWSFVGDVNVALDLYWLKLQSLDASASGMLTLDLDPEAIFYQAISGGGEKPLVAPVKKVFGAWAGPVPVWVEVTMELNAGFTYSADVSGNAYTSIHAQKEIAFSVRMRESEWSREFNNPALILEGDPITWNIEGNANAKVYVQPKLTILVYSVAGVGVDIKPYVELDGRYQSEPLEWEWGLYMGISSTLSIENRIGLPEPEWEMFNIRKLLLDDSYPDVAPSFIAPFPDRTVQVGQSLTLSAQASGMPAPSYQWYYNGDTMTWATSAEYIIPYANAGHTGTYSVQASNSSGTVDASCYVTVTSGCAGMTWVYMNDPGVPDHEGFTGYMSRYETTNAQYCEFLNAALASGDIYISSNRAYGSNGANSGTDFVGQVYFETYAADEFSQIIYNSGSFSVRSRDGYSMNNHPVVMVSWYGATAFCNYYGYRLPTEWEWQAVADYDGSYIYGCGTTINQSKANYYNGGYANPLGLASIPYTSPVNYYSSYGYGMNDMAGNVWEWTSTVSGTSRVIRSGSWTYNFYECLVSDRTSFNPNITNYGFGFRVCR